jgi:hypothetical protein
VAAVLERLADGESFAGDSPHYALNDWMSAKRRAIEEVRARAPRSTPRNRARSRLRCAARCCARA